MPPTFSYVQCQFAGMRFVVRIESRLLPAAIRGSARELQVTPAPAFCAGLPASSFAAIEGNKLYKLGYYLQHMSELPPVSKIWSYGSVQSGAMLALSELAQLMGVEFHYVLPYIASELALHPEGNLALAKGKQMHLHVDGALYRRMARGEFVPAPGELFFHEGGNHSQVSYGMTVLAQELSQVTQKLNLSRVFLPAGTGVTSYHLAQATRNWRITPPRPMAMPCTCNRYLRAWALAAANQPYSVATSITALVHCTASYGCCRPSLKLPLA
ncbi:hypothetical protein [Methylobacillus glycogenes]|uniref:hypothetical protein n=1 Tax=Methylobacillus glycogenes TaxID=406 RepID=UPI0004726711|nr:hypothetical protein [Methylobacillus glycogenes]